MNDPDTKRVLLEAMYSVEDDTVEVLTESADHEALLGLMYDIDAEDEPEEKPKQDRPYGIMNMPRMSSEIRKMQEIIDSQNRMIKRINQRLRKLERHSGDITREVNNLGSEIETKVDRNFR